MTTSATQSISMKPSSAAFTRRELAAFEGYAQNAAHNAVLAAFEKVRGSVTKASIARKLGVSPSQVTRWLGSPGNYEIKTLGYLLGAMGYVPTVAPVEIANLTKGSNFAHEVVDYPASSAVQLQSQSVKSSDPNTTIIHGLQPQKNSGPAPQIVLVASR